MRSGVRDSEKPKSGWFEKVLKEKTDERNRTDIEAKAEIAGGRKGMEIELERVKPAEIEARSFEIITEELGETGLSKLIPGTEPIVKRCIHTSAVLIMRRICVFPKAWWTRH